MWLTFVFRIFCHYYQNDKHKFDKNKNNNNKIKGLFFFKIRPLIKLYS